MDESTPQTKQQTHVLCLRQFVPEDRFYQEFNNRVRSFKTLLCFGFGEHSKVLWDIWGHTYNNPRHDHAETIALRAVDDFLKQCQRDTNQKYVLTMYLSFSPCAKCCRSLAAFARSQTTVKVNVMVSRLYFPEDNETQKNLKDLVLLGVKLRVMGREDFKKCYYLFVNYCSSFEEWPELEQESEKLSDFLKAILNQVPKVFSSSLFYTILNGSIRLSLTPLHVGPSWTPQGRETPQKATSVTQDTTWVQGVKRKLFDEG
ncbi:DNA dC [Arapaima gigas]